MSYTVFCTCMPDAITHTHLVIDHEAMWQSGLMCQSGMCEVVGSSLPGNNGLLLFLPLRWLMQHWQLHANMDCVCWSDSACATAS